MAVLPAFASLSPLLPRTFSNSIFHCREGHGKCLCPHILFALPAVLGSHDVYSSRITLFPVKQHRPPREGQIRRCLRPNLCLFCRRTGFAAFLPARSIASDPQVIDLNTSQNPRGSRGWPASNPRHFGGQAGLESAAAEERNSQTMMPRAWNVFRILRVSDSVQDTG
ncbi:hypothetical protein B0H10DRAFT_1112879 [Mycena sp. CBHHK59/15]|nr:hypothetical protein B0H10DRAFT_1112879 [Mycena sp. CBHHK59/15]